MSSEVIELGSSDEDPEPTPKKSKSIPNAMVHIPKKLPGVTIKPAKPKINPLSNGVVIKASPIKLLNAGLNPNKLKTYGKVQKPVIKQGQLKMPMNINNSFMNPIRFKTIPVQTRNPIPPGTVIKNAMKVQGAGCLKNLPSTITVKRTAQKRVSPNVIVHNPKKKLRPTREVLTVDLEDDDSKPSGRQWYLTPEEQDSMNISEQNNTEPDIPKYIEITIEDSPIKPEKLKSINASKMEVSITINDSPYKPGTHKQITSDEETGGKKEVPHSKKKLVYPKPNNNANDSDKIEVQLTPTNSADTTNPSHNVVDYIVEIEESPIKYVEAIQNNNPEKKKPGDPCLNNTEVETAIEIQDDADEFHPVYKSFIDLCFKLENSDDMKKIVEKKIKAYYRQVPKEYTESEDFIDVVSSKILSMKAGPEKMYLYIKDIVDELNFKRKLAKSEVIAEGSKNKDLQKELYGENSEFDSKHQRQIRRLEKTLKKLHRAIQKLEEQEVDFDDDEDSVYLLTERYKERLVRVHAKFCQLTNTKMPSEPRVQIEARPGRPKGPARRLEKFINKKVPIGKPLPFPDFHDVLRCVRDANEEDKLGWNEAVIMEEARDLFTRCGRKLQRRRQENEWRIAVSRISDAIDPPEENEELKIKLYKNTQTAVKNETELLNKFADRQNLLKLEAEEIGDKEAEESPDESEDDEVNTEATSLETTEKRKERLKRLLQEKCKKLNNEHDIEDETSETVEEMTDLKNNENINKTSVEVINNEKTDNDNIVQSVSDDTNAIESDIDELHLLQKLHSGNEISSSTAESSDADTPIAISDTLDSSSDEKKTRNEDVISIENSSYSESENLEKQEPAKKSPKPDKINEKIEDSINQPTKPKIKRTEIMVQNVLKKSNNHEYNDTVENILLAPSSSDEDDKDLTEKKISAFEAVTEAQINNVDKPKTNENREAIYEKLKEISIDETILQVENNTIDKNFNKSMVNENNKTVDMDFDKTMTIKNRETITQHTKDDSMSVDETALEVENNTITNDLVEPKTNENHEEAFSQKLKNDSKDEAAIEVQNNKVDELITDKNIEMFFENLKNDSVLIAEPILETQNNIDKTLDEPMTNEKLEAILSETTTNILEDKKC